MLKLIITNHPIKELNTKIKVKFSINNDEWPYLATNINEKATFLYMSIIANVLNYYNIKDEDNIEDYEDDDVITEIYNNLDDKNYENILKSTLDKYNISYEFDDSELDSFEENYSEFSQCALDTLNDYDFYNPKVLHTIMKNEVSLLNFLFSNESGLY